MILLNPVDGQVKSLYALENKVVDQDFQDEIDYVTYGAITYDQRDYIEKKPYFYTSFMMDGKV